MDDELFDEPTLGDYLAILWRRKWWVIISTVVLTSAVAAYTLSQDDQYRSTATVLVRGSAVQDVVDPLATNSQIRFRDLQNELTFAESDRVLDIVEEQIPEDVDVSVRADDDADILLFSATGPTGEIVATSADLYASVYVEQRQLAASEAYLSALALIETELAELAERRAEVRQPLDELEDQLNTASGSQQASLAVDVIRLQNELAPELAALDAQQSALSGTLAELQLSADLISANSATVSIRGEVPEAPFSPAVRRNLVLGVVLGLIVGVGLALLRESLDTRVRSRDVLHRMTGFPNLGGIPPERSGGDPARRIMDEPDHPVAEAYRTVRAAVEFATTDRGIRTVLVTSPNKSEGKTSVASNLAVSLADAGRSVVLMDFDLRRPRQHRVFQLSREPGVTSVLLDGLELDDVARQVFEETDLRVVPSGALVDSPAELISSRSVDQMLQTATKMGEIVIIDAPPLLPVVDAQHLARVIDAVVMVASADYTSKSDARAASEALGRVAADVLGTVLIGDSSGGGRYGYGYYGERPPRKIFGIRIPRRRRKRGKNEQSNADRTPVSVS